LSKAPTNLKVASKLSIREAMAAGWQLFATKFWTCFWMLILAGFVVCIPHLLIFFFWSFLHQGPLLKLILLVLYPVAIITVVVVSLGTFTELEGGSLCAKGSVKVFHRLAAPCVTAC
jgi:hypothetical protein